MASIYHRKNRRKWYYSYRDGYDRVLYEAAQIGTPRA